MATVNYNAEAELFPPRRRSLSKGPIGYNRFDSAAEAIRFQWRSSHRSYFSAPTSRSKRTGSMALPFDSSMRARPTH